MILKFFKINPSVEAPVYSTKHSACFDLFAWIPADAAFDCYTPSNRKITIHSNSAGRLTIKPNDRVLIPSGLIFQLPDDYSLRLHMRSSVSLKTGLVMPNSQGIIDSDYFHQTFFLLTNTLPMQSVTIENGTRLCQGELVKVHQVKFQEIYVQPEQTTDRVGGIGSTGK